jgi:hypothetical protein
MHAYSQSIPVRVSLGCNHDILRRPLFYGYRNGHPDGRPHNRKPEHACRALQAQRHAYYAHTHTFCAHVTAFIMVVTMYTYTHPDMYKILLLKGRVVCHELENPNGKLSYIHT